MRRDASYAKPNVGIVIIRMNCFVIMPFAPEFDDVYHSIQTSVSGAVSAQSCRCFRLDESRPAGRITERLLQELRSASLCIADITGDRPNVMWEVGYAMALDCPTILLTQKRDDRPFDIKDMQTLTYDRNKLHGTLVQPLQGMIVDTMSTHLVEKRNDHEEKNLVGALVAEIKELKKIVAQAVHSWSPPSSLSKTSKAPLRSLRALEGAWVNRESGSHAYAKIVGNNLWTPYCYGGNRVLTGFYFGWRRVGEYWFARYKWLETPHAGFTFLKHESVDVLRGAWWSDDGQLDEPSSPPETAGVSANWQRKKGGRSPNWALQFFDKIEQNRPPSV